MGRPKNPMHAVVAATSRPPRRISLWCGHGVDESDQEMTLSIIRCCLSWVVVVVGYRGGKASLVGYMPSSTTFWARCIEFDRPKPL